jgi:hypothetical protein
MYRVLSSTGEGDEATIIATLNNVRGSSARVVSLSFGGFPTNGVEPPLAATIRELRKAGKVVVAAAGNAQEDPEFRGRTMFPASMPEVIAVGAYDSTKDEPTLWPHSNPADVYSVGVDLVSTYVGWSDGRHVPTLDAWARWSGSSFATPLVAARYAAEDGLRLADIGEEAAGDWPGKSAWPQTMSSKESKTPRRYDLKINLTA